MNLSYKAIASLILISSATIVSCSTTTNTVEQHPQQKKESTVLDQAERPLPYPVDIPANFKMAELNGTRTETGAPGQSYWQNYAYYTLSAEIDTATHVLYGNSQVTYENNSPNALHVIVIELIQNLHKKGLPKHDKTEITDGMNLSRILVNGEEIKETTILKRWTQNESGYIQEGTHLYIYPENPVKAGEATDFGFEWSFEIPQKGASGEDSGRMGRNENLYYIGYWYPQIAVYDDVYGWFNDPFVGNAEFYHEFADYDVTITAPENWLVMATGEFMNPEKTLSENVLKRYQEAGKSDSVITIVDFDETDQATLHSADGKLTWRFQAYNVNDVAFSMTRDSRWDGTRTPVGDLNNDGKTDYTRIHSFYRESAPLWTEQAAFAQHSISFLSEYTGLPYPWPHMTSVEGEEIISGGMEYPMMTLISDYNQAGAVPLYGVTVHELAHMWVPMLLSTNERRYTWMDEGYTRFHETLASAAKYGDNRFDQMAVFSNYMQIAGTELEGELMRWSDYHYYPTGYSIASYEKPASVLFSLKEILGEELFLKAHREFIQRWAHKHPYPWDMFRTYEDVSGMDLSWFWRSWYYETWVLDQGVGDISQDGDETVIEIIDYGNVPMPAYVQVEFNDGNTVTKKIDVNYWLNGYRSKEIRIQTESPVKNVTIDPDYLFPDVDRSNNQWSEK